MPRAWIACICLVAAAALAVFWKTATAPPEQSTLFEPPLPQLEAAPLCPWREPGADLLEFFPGATGHVEVTRILSGLRVELAKHLGRPPEAEENALTFHRVFAGPETLGFVLTRRVKGEHGAIELVLAVDPAGEVLEVSLQRLREPESLAAEIQDTGWLGRFKGRTHERGWELDDASGLSEEARFSAQAIREGVRSLLVLRAAADGLYGDALASQHSHITTHPIH